MHGRSQAGRELKSLSSDIDRVERAARNADRGGLSRFRGGLGSMLGGVGRLTNALGRGLRGALLGVGRWASRGAAIGAAALGGLATAAVVVGVRTASAMEQAKIGFTTMLGSARRASKFLERLKRFAEKTPFEFPELQDAAQKFLAFGFEAKEIIPTLTAVGDAVAGLGAGGEGIEAVTRALGQIQAKGKASAEEMLQMAEAGIPAWQFLADALGKSIPDAMDDVSKGAVDAETTISAMVDGMNRKFGGLMARQSTTMGGLFSTLKDTVGMGLGGLVEPFAPAIRKALKRITAAASRAMTGPLARAASALGGLVDDAIRGDASWGSVFEFFSQVGMLFARIVGGAFTSVNWAGVGRTIAGGIFDGIASYFRDVHVDFKELIFGDPMKAVTAGAEGSGFQAGFGPGGPASGGSFGGTDDLFDNAQFKSNLGDAQFAWNAYLADMEGAHKGNVSRRKLREAQSAKDFIGRSDGAARAYEHRLGRMAGEHNRTIDRLNDRVTIALDASQLYSELRRVRRQWVDTMETLGMGQQQVLSLARRDDALANRGRAVGGTVAPGFYRVGERGPETVHIPAIGQVDRNDEVRRGGDGATLGRPIEIPVVVNDREIARASVEGIRALEARR